MSRLKNCPLCGGQSACRLISLGNDVVRDVGKACCKSGCGMPDLPYNVWQKLPRKDPLQRHKDKVLKEAKAMRELWKLPADGRLKKVGERWIPLVESVLKLEERKHAIRIHSRSL